MLYNVQSGTSMLTNAFGKQVVEVLLAHAGETLDAPTVQAALREALNKPVPLEPVAQMLQRLCTGGIALTNSEDLAIAAPRYRRTGLRLYIRLFDLDAYVKNGKPFWWHPITLALVLLAAVGGATALVLRYAIGGVALPDENRIWHMPITAVLILLLLFYFSAITHELSHALACKRYNLRVGSVGLMIAGLVPNVFVDTNAVYTMPQNRRRIAVSITGPLASLGIGGLVSIALALVPAGSDIETALWVALLGILTTIVLSLNPFWRGDGYYILSDLLHEPNLRDHVRGYVFSRITRQPYRGRNVPRPRLYWGYVAGTILTTAAALALIAFILPGIISAIWR